jgi:hypothetical protein
VTWIALDCDLFDHPKMVDLPSDSARYGWIVTLSKAKRQRNAGSFASTKHFSHVMGKFGKFADTYVKAGLLEKADDGSLTIHDWRKHQWAASKAKIREDEGETSGGLNVDIEETLSGSKEDSRAGSAVPVLNSSSSKGVVKGDDDEPEFPLVQWLAKHGSYVTPGNGYHRHLITAVERHGAPAILRMFDKLSRAGVVDGDTKGFVFGATDALNPRPNLKAVDAADAEDSARRDYDRRVERTKQQIAELRGGA